MPRQPLPRKAKDADSRLIYSLLKTGSYVDLSEFQRLADVPKPEKSKKKERKGNNHNNKKPRRPYNSMVLQALRHMKGTPQGLASVQNYIEANFAVGQSSKRFIKAALVRLIKKGRIKKVKNSFVLTKYASKKKQQTDKPLPAPAEKKARAKKPAKLAKKVSIKGLGSVKPLALVSQEQRSRAFGMPLPLKADRPTVTPAGYSFRWEFLGRQTGWRAYEINASDVLEAAYQHYLQNPGMCDVRAVQSGRWTYQVDFINMKQTNIQHPDHTTRSLRRLPFGQD